MIRGVHSLKNETMAFGAGIIELLFVHDDKNSNCTPYRNWCLIKKNKHLQLNADFDTVFARNAIVKVSKI